MSAFSAEILLPGNSIRNLKGIKVASVRQCEFEHDLLTFELPGAHGRQVSLRSNEPLRTKLVFQTQHLEFVGYVHSVIGGDQRRGKEQATIIQVMGASYRLKTARQRAWTRTTVSKVATQIAIENRLTPDVERHPFVFDLLTQPGISDWQTLVKFAKRVGWVVFVSGTTLVFRSRGRDLKTERRRAPIALFNGHDLDKSKTYATAFRPILSESMPYEEGMKSSRTLWGVNPHTTAVVKSTAAGARRQTDRVENPRGLFDTFDVGCVSSSAAEARLRANGHADLAQYQHRAHLECNGVGRLRQCQQIYVSGVPGDYEGYWNTIEVNHQFVGDQYTMSAELGTDSLGHALITQVPEVTPGAMPAPGKTSLQITQATIFDKKAGSQRGGRNGYTWVGGAVPHNAALRSPKAKVKHRRA